jgi:hypothetical protein
MPKTGTSQSDYSGKDSKITSLYNTLRSFDKATSPADFTHEGAALNRCLDELVERRELQVRGAERLAIERAHPGKSFLRDIINIYLEPSPGLPDDKRALWCDKPLYVALQLAARFNRTKLRKNSNRKAGSSDAVYWPKYGAFTLASLALNAPDGFKAYTLGGAANARRANLVRRQDWRAINPRRAFLEECRRRYSHHAPSDYPVSMDDYIWMIERLLSHMDDVCPSAAERPQERDAA